MTTYALGKRPATTGAVKLRLVNYLDTSALPPIPAEYGHEALVGADWSMLGNDKYGDCVWAGAAHESMLWTREAQTPATFSEASVLKAYSAVTGFDPKTGAGDNGTDMLAACKYRRRTGILDAAGKRHKIGAYLALDPGDVDQLHAAVYLFDGVGIGVEFPTQWMDAFNAGRPWDRVTRPKQDGGHYITGVCRRAGRTGVVTWGRVQWLTDAGYAQFNDESYVYLAPEKLHGGVDMQGLDLAHLKTDLAYLTGL